MMEQQTATAELDAVSPPALPQSMALAPTDTAPDDSEIEQFRKRGAVAVAHKREVDRLFRVIEGMTWGSGAELVRGSTMLPAMRYALAEFCKLTRANPLYHVNLFHGQPYLNAHYWVDRITAEPTFHRLEQRDLSPSTEQQARDSFERIKAEADATARSHPEISAKLREKAYEMFFKAEDIAAARANWSAPEWATDVSETTIWRLPETAPLARIKAGELAVEDYLIEVRECNWAGGRPVTKRKRSAEKGGGEYEFQSDPIGNAEAAKTARTRSLRRTGAIAFPATLQEYERQIHKVEQVIEAQWSELVDARKSASAALPRNGEPQAFAIGAGEPQVARTEGAQPMPVREVTEFFVPRNDASPPAPVAPVEDAVLVDARQRYHEGCFATGVDDSEQFALDTLHHAPVTVEDYRQLNAALSARIDGED